MATMSRRSGGAFRSPAFTRFYLGQALSYVGDGLRTIAIPLLVFKLTASAVSLGLTFALEIAPFAIFSLVGGSLADRLERRRLMLVCDGVRFTIMLLFAAAYATHRLTLPLLYAGVVLLAICGAIFLGCQSPSIPYLLGKDGAKSAVAALFATEQGANLIAPPVGGALFTLMGPLPALLLNALTYLTSQVSIASVKDFGPERPSGVPDLREIVADVVAGWRFVMRDAALRSLTFAQLFINAFAIMGFVVVIPYLKREFGASDQLVGLTFGAISVGTVIGSVVSGRTHWPFGKALIAAFILDSLTWSPTIWTHSLPVAIVAMTAASACGIYAVSSLVAWRMRIIPEAMVGRVFGVIRLVVIIGMLPGSLAGGAIGDRYGTRTAMLISSAGYATLALGLLSMKSLRNDRR
jgi:MFS family permease